MDRKQYMKREALGVLLYPFFFLLIMGIVITLGWTHTPITREVLIDVLVVTLLASLCALGVSAFLVFKNRRWK